MQILQRRDICTLVIYLQQKLIFNGKISNLTLIMKNLLYSCTILKNKKKISIASATLNHPVTDVK